MQAAGMQVRQDSIGNLIGRYAAAGTDAKTLLTPFLPRSSQQVFEMLGGQGTWSGMPEIKEVDEEGGPSYPAITGQYDNLGRWAWPVIIFVLAYSLLIIGVLSLPAPFHGADKVVGYGAYNLGVLHGLAVNGSLTTAVAQPPGAVPVVVYPYGWHRPWGFGLFPFLVLAFWFVVARAFFWRGPWRG
ncbi:hypothetical protein B4Q13_15910, partial [Lacticaseibacillus rhamnosus]